MKKLLIVAAMLASVGAYAQARLGTVNFANVAGPAGARLVDAPVFDVGGATRLAGPGFQAQLFAGPNAGSMATIGPSVGFLTGTGAGYFSGGPREITGVNAGAAASVQVRAWSVSSGATFDAASIRGSSPVLNLTATGNAGEPPSLPVNLVGLQQFSLVPEPSTIALGALGALALLFRRRK